MEIVRLQSIDSTNSLAMEMAADGALHGTAVIAESQTRGRGRLGKSWQSPPGTGMYSSIVLRPDIEAEDYPYLTFVAGLAVVDAIKSLYQATAGLKWPNDIFFSMKKCGGILSESSALSGEKLNRYAVIGIGLNVNTTKEQFPEDVAPRATSLLLETGRRNDIEDVFGEIRSSLLARVESFEKYGFEPVLQRWRKHDCMLGKRLSWVTVSGEVVEGVSLGPDELGRLHIRDDCGKVHEVLSGDVQLARV